MSNSRTKEKPAKVKDFCKEVIVAQHTRAMKICSFGKIGGFLWNPASKPCYEASQKLLEAIENCEENSEEYKLKSSNLADRRPLIGKRPK